jgi:hypothetical protein
VGDLLDGGPRERRLTPSSDAPAAETAEPPAPPAPGAAADGAGATRFLVAYLSLVLPAVGLRLDPAGAAAAAVGPP